MGDDLVKMARLAQHDERMSTGALYGDLADRIEELERYALPYPQPAPAEDAKAKGETDGETLERLGMDGAKWAAEFRTTALRLGYSDMNEGWLIGWFANAIMAGYDRKPAPDAAAMADRIEELEAKLAKAVDVAEKSIKWLRLYGADVHREAATLAGLTGGKDE